MWIEQKYFDIIKKSMPIPCVDILVMNNVGHILMVRRNNEPAKSEWWFPGGRIYYGETRKFAAQRKLKEECGIIVNALIEQGTYDLLLNYNNKKTSHGITTLFKTKIATTKVYLDNQSSDYDWRKAKDWLKEDLNDFLITTLTKILN